MLRKAPSEKNIFNDLEYTILVVNQSFEIVLCNDAVSQLWGRDKKKIIGKQLSQLLPKDSLILQHINEVLQEGKNFTIGDYPLWGDQNNQKIVNISMSPVAKKSQKLQHAIITIHDLTHQFEVKVKEHEKAVLDSLDAFVSSIAHEIQNPLSGIKGITQLLKRDLAKGAMSTQPVEMILTELGRIDRLVKELLLHSQPIPLDFCEVNVHELLDTVIWFEDNSSRTPISFQRFFDPSIPDIFADRDKLHQVFLNLIKNAVEASPKNGKIIIRSNYCPQWEIIGKNLDIHQEYYLIEFEDEGSGILPENKDRLFSPLFTTKKSGHGLGLSISFRIVSEHGGLLQYKPAPSGGAIFQVYIPRVPMGYENQNHENK